MFAFMESEDQVTKPCVFTRTTDSWISLSRASMCSCRIMADILRKPLLKAFLTFLFITGLMQGKILQMNIAVTVFKKGNFAARNSKNSFNIIVKIIVESQSRPKLRNLCTISKEKTRQ